MNIHNPEKYRKKFESMSAKEISDMNALTIQKSQEQLECFKRFYKVEKCYLCGKDFKTMSINDPCLHWLLRQCKFKKKDFRLIYEKYSYHQIAAFIRWCANEDKFLANINDLKEEKSDKKIISYTVKWRNIEWTFDCTKNDFEGHSGSGGNFPHYHFQMRVDNRQFINFNDFHIPFNDYDLFNLSIRDEPWAICNFGVGGVGMQDAVNVPLDSIIEHSSKTDNENDGVYHFSTIIESIDNPITDKEIEDIKNEMNRTGKSFAFVAKKLLANRPTATMQTIVSPVETIPDIAKRTENKGR